MLGDETGYFHFLIGDPCAPSDPVVYYCGHNKHDQLALTNGKFPPNTNKLAVRDCNRLNFSHLAKQTAFGVPVGPKAIEMIRKDNTSPFGGFRYIVARKWQCQWPDGTDCTFPTWKDAFVEARTSAVKQCPA